MNKKTLFFAFALIGLSHASHALDPVAPVSERAYGRVSVKSPKDTDKITLTGTSPQVAGQSLPQATQVKVNVGSYNVRVEMDGGQVYTQDIQVTPTESTDLVVPGYGNLKVNGAGGTVSVFKGSQKVADFNVGEVRTLPRDTYDVKITSGGHTLSMNGVWVVTNTTRELDISNTVSSAPAKK